MLGSSSAYTLGSTGGSATTTLTKANLPATKLQLDSFSLGRGTMEITGAFDGVNNQYGYANGAFYKGGSSAGAGSGGGDTGVQFQASRSWTGMSTSAAPFTTNMGDGTPFNNMPPYLVCNVWKRLT
ncbi:hypothetical protein ABF214_04535 [Fusobacterium sp. THCT1E1]